MRVVELPEILAAFDEKTALAAVEAGFRRLAAGEADLMAVGYIGAASLIELGKLLAAPVVFADDDIVVADLTGVAVQDVQIAKAIWSRLSGTAR